MNASSCCERFGHWESTRRSETESHSDAGKACRQAVTTVRSRDSVDLRPYRRCIRGIRKRVRNHATDPSRAVARSRGRIAADCRLLAIASTGAAPIHATRLSTFIETGPTLRHNDAQWSRVRATETEHFGP